MSVFLIILVLFFAMIIRAFASAQISYFELSLTASMVLIGFLKVVRLDSVVAWAGLIYVISTTFRAIFPVAQEPKACYITHGGPPPIVDRFVAFFGEVGLAIAMAFILAPMSRWIGLPRSAAVTLLVGIILVSEILCFYACVSDPNIHDREDDGWRLFASVILGIAVAAVFRTRDPQERVLAVVALTGALGFLWYMKNTWATHNGAVHALQFETDWFKCHEIDHVLWTSVFRWQYLYFCAAALGVVVMLLLKPKGRGSEKLSFNFWRSPSISV